MGLLLQSYRDDGRQKKPGCPKYKARRIPGTELGDSVPFKLKSSAPDYIVKPDPKSCMFGAIRDGNLSKVKRIVRSWGSDAAVNLVRALPFDEMKEPMQIMAPEHFLGIHPGPLSALNAVVATTSPLIEAVKLGQEAIVNLFVDKHQAPKPFKGQYKVCEIMV